VLLPAEGFEQRKARRIGQREVEHHAIEGSLGEMGETFRRAVRADRFDFVRTEQ
jgi:hypothetical protein